MNDLISRQAAIDAIEHRLAEPAYQHTGEDWYVGMNCAESELYELPSAQPERRGRWIKLDMHAHLADHKCTACGQECYVPTCMGEPMYTYCPNCGADMREEQK